jgi:hypothetical protein
VAATAATAATVATVAAQAARAAWEEAERALAAVAAVEVLAAAVAMAMAAAVAAEADTARTLFRSDGGPSGTQLRHPCTCGTASMPRGPRVVYPSLRCGRRALRKLFEPFRQLGFQPFTMRLLSSWTPPNRQLELAGPSRVNCTQSERGVPARVHAST